MPTFHVAVLLPQIRKNFEVDEDALDEMITELDKGKILSAHQRAFKLICFSTFFFRSFFPEENGLITKENFEKVCEHFLAAK